MGVPPGREREDAAEGALWTSTTDAAIPTLGVGAQVYVRNRFLGDWTSGFQVAEVLDGGYRLRRLSDGYAFPDVFASDDVRLERRQSPTYGTAASHRDRRH
jgi:hypothetical protein